jgi:hypothetical protein
MATLHDDDNDDATTTMTTEQQLAGWLAGCMADAALV